MFDTHNKFALTGMRAVRWRLRGVQAPTGLYLSKLNFKHTFLYTYLHYYHYLIYCTDNYFEGLKQLCIA